MNCFYSRHTLQLFLRPILLPLTLLSCKSYNSFSYTVQNLYEKITDFVLSLSEEGTKVVLDMDG